MPSVTYRWLGAAGLEITCGDYTLLVDPFFTRPSSLALLTMRRVEPDAGLVRRYITRADAVLVTHAHYDHLLDVPAVMRAANARAFGSPNTCALLAANGIALGRLNCIRVGDRFTLGPFQVEVFPARHTRTPLDRWVNGPLAPGLRVPLRLVDYRMDECFSFHIRVGEQALLVGNHPAPADVLFVSPYHPLAVFASLLQAAGPCRVVPIHWDDFTRPLSKPLRPMLVSRAQGVSGFPPVRRLDPSLFAVAIRALRPGLDVLVPEIFKPYPLS